MERDETWASMVAAAERLTTLYCRHGPLAVYAHERGTSLTIRTEGLLAADNWTDVFEPVRQRRTFGSRWTTLQSVEQAARQIETFLIERPDQQGEVRDRVWADMYTAAERMSNQYDWPVKAERQREGSWLIQGLITYGPTCFEPVRRRRWFARAWEAVQGVESAASHIGVALRDGRRELCPTCSHPKGYHPGRVEARACAYCIADEDQHKITAEQMCVRKFSEKAP